MGIQLLPNFVEIIMKLRCVAPCNGILLSFCRGEPDPDLSLHPGGPWCEDQHPIRHRDSLCDIMGDQNSRFVFLFNINVLSQLKGFAGIQSVLSTPLHITKDTHPLIYNDIYQTLLDICKEYLGGSVYNELYIFSLLIKMLITLYENHLQTADLFQNVNISKHQEYVSKFGHLLEYIDTHYTEDLTLEDMEGMIGFSKYHFSRLFKQYTNYTFCEYLKNRRIQAAEILLEKPDCSITEVALQSGFPSISTFNRIFKEHKNCTPTEFRNLMIKRRQHN